MTPLGGSSRRGKSSGSAKPCQSFAGSHPGKGTRPAAPGRRTGIRPVICDPIEPEPSARTMFQAELLNPPAILRPSSTVLASSRSVSAATVDAAVPVAHDHREAR